MGFWDGFGKYLGVQGVLAFLLVGGYIYMAIALVTPPQSYDLAMGAVCGFYFAKNGRDIFAGVNSAIGAKGTKGE